MRAAAAIREPSSSLGQRSSRLGQPFDGLGYSISTGFRLLPLVDPPCVLVAVGEGQMLVRGLGRRVVCERLGELRRLHDDSLLLVLNEFNLDQVADRHIKLPEQIFPEAEIALTAINHEPGAVFDAVDMRQDRRPLGAECLGDLSGYDYRVAATLARREDFGRERHGPAIYELRRELISFQVPGKSTAASSILIASPIRKGSTPKVSALPKDISASTIKPAIPKT